MDELIIIKRSELIRAIEKTLVNLGYGKVETWISQHQAAQLIGRHRLRKAMLSGVIWFRRDFANNRIYVLRADIEKILNNGKL